MLYDVNVKGYSARYYCYKMLILICQMNNLKSGYVGVTAPTFIQAFTLAQTAFNVQLASPQVSCLSSFLLTPFHSFITALTKYYYFAYAHFCLTHLYYIYIICDVDIINEFLS